MTKLQKIVVTWRYWDKRIASATRDVWAEYHNELLAAERELRDAADRLAAKESE